MEGKQNGALPAKSFLLSDQERDFLLDLEKETNALIAQFKEGAANLNAQQVGVVRLAAKRLGIKPEDGMLRVSDDKTHLIQEPQDGKNSTSVSG